MKVLLFTHEQDIDGIGCAILARKAFTDVNYIPCKTFAITSEVSNNVLGILSFNFVETFSPAEVYPKSPFVKDLTQEKY